MVKVVLFFNSDQHGWTETWYSPASTVAQVDLDSDPLWLNFLNKRWNFLDNASYIYGARVSLIGGTKSQRPWFFNQRYYTTPIRLANPIYNPLSVPNDAVLLFLDSAFNKKYLYMRGCQSQLMLTVPGNDPEFAPQFTDYLTPYMASIQALQLAVGTVNRIGVGGITANTITLIAPSPLNENWSRCTLVTPPAYTIGPGFYNGFHGIDHNAIPGFPKKALIQAQGVAPNYIDIPYTYRAATNTYAPPKASTYAVVTNYTPIASVETVRWTERSTGRPFGLLPGRARSLVKAH